MLGAGLIAAGNAGLLLGGIWELAMASTVLGLGMVVVAVGVFFTRFLKTLPVIRRHVLDHIAIGVIAVDSQGRMVEMNPAARDLLPTAAVGQYIADIPNLCPSLLEHLRVLPTIRETVTCISNMQPNYLDVQITPLPDQTGHLIMLQNITERKEAETAVRKSQAQFYKVFQSSPFPMVITNLPEGRYVEINHAFEEVTGHQRADAVGQTASRVIWRNVGDRQRWLDELQKTGRVDRYEVELLAANAETLITKISSILIQHDDQQQVLSIIEDVTSERRATVALRQRETQYQAVVDMQTELIIRYRPDDTVTFVNAAYCRFFSVNAEDVIGTLRPIPLHPDDVEHVRRYRHQLESGELTEGRLEARFRSPDGSYRWLQWVDVPVTDETGHVAEIQAIGRDIHDQKMMEQALREREAQYRAVVDVQSELIVQFDVNDVTLFVNDAYCRYFGRSRDDLIGCQMALTIHPDDVDRREAYSQHLRSGVVDRSTFELRFQVPDDSWRWTQWIDTVIRDESGNISHIQAVGRDIHDQRMMEQALREREAQYRAVVDVQTELIIRYDTDEVITFVNDAYCRYFNRSRGELLGHQYRPAIHPDDQKRVNVYRQQLNSGAVDRSTLELRFQVPDGSWRWTQWIDTVIRDENGDISQFQAVGRDIHDQRMMEQALREREAQYRAVVNSQTEFIVRYKPDGTVTFVNDAYCRYFGVRRDEIIGKLRTPPIYLDDVERGVAYRNRMQRGEMREATAELRFVLPDGQVRWSQWVDVAIFDEDGHVVEVQAIGRDIHERKLIEQELRHSEERHRIISEISADFSFALALDESGITLEWITEAFTRITGHNPNVLTDETIWLGLVHPDDHASYRRTINALQESDQDQAHVLRVTTADGAIRHIHFYVRPVWHDGRLVRLYGAGQDITSQREAQQRVLELAAKQREIRLLKNFIGMASHHFRNPLAAMNTSIYVLGQRPGEQAKSRALNSLTVQVRYLDQLVNGLLMMSELDNNPTLQLGPVRVERLVSQLVVKIRQRLEEADLTLETDVQPNVPPVQADDQRLHWALYEVFSNAIFFTPPGGTITLRAYAADDQMCISISDTGIGIEDTDMPHIFERFYRADKARTDTSRPGLGLSIAEAIVKAHNGTIKAESIPGTGSTFTIEIPLKLPTSI